MVGSKQAVLSIQVLNALLGLIEVKIQFTLQHLPFFVEEIMQALLNFLNDTNQKVKELAYRVYQSLP